jgi:hypothetical protein
MVHKKRRLAGCLGLLAVLPAGALPFHQVYGRSFQSAS